MRSKNKSIKHLYKNKSTPSTVSVHAKYKLRYFEQKIIVGILVGIVVLLIYTFTGGKLFGRNANYYNLWRRWLQQLKYIRICATRWLSDLLEYILISHAATVMTPTPTINIYIYICIRSSLFNGMTTLSLYEISFCTAKPL